ncbi:MAG: glycosyltransferase [Saprospiraceae bacterium]
MQLSIIIVNYNVQHFLEQCLLSVRKAVAQIPPGGEAEIFVVDNNSVDNSVAMVREKFPEVKFIVNTENTGFAVANNQAIRRSTGRYVLLLNPDTVVREDTFVKCLGFMEAHPEAGGLGVKMIDGSGKFLPESKRGFPSPFVAFAKTFGLSALFPKSKIFNRYHLGYLDRDETHKVDVLAGAFMLLRRSVLDKTGLLDEAFFMYGEDIDLSYRIVQAGYKNYYFAGTTIIHYKGESTKKGSLNYVRTFYNAMLIFARKHFTGRQARLFIAMIYGAIYLRAGLTLVTNFFKKAALPLMDAVVICGGLLFLKYFWARYYYHDPGYYDPKFVFFNVPFYTAMWLGAVFFTGGYDEPYNLRRLARGLLIGTLVLSAVYGFLPLELRPSRAILLLGAVWAMGGTVALRTAVHFFNTGNLGVGMPRPGNLVIAGSPEESERVRTLLSQVQVQKNFIGTVVPNSQFSILNSQLLSTLDRLDEVVQIYKIDEIIFCSRDVSSESIMEWMSRLGPGLDYKIVPQESISIIGSSSKDAAGELYTIDIRFKIATPMARRNKRVFDLLFAVFCLLFVPVFLVFVKNRGSFFGNIFQVFSGKKSWVSYASHQSPVTSHHLPKIRPGILSPLDALGKRQLDDATIQRLNFLYAKDYDVWRDLEVVWKGARELGRQQIMNAEAQ